MGHKGHFHFSKLEYEQEKLVALVIESVNVIVLYRVPHERLDILVLLGSMPYGTST